MVLPKHRIARATLLLALLAGAAPVPAAGAGADDGPATALVRQGVELRRQGRDEEALAAFKQAFELAKKPSIRAQLALAEQALGRWVEAERDLDAALAEDSDAWIMKQRPVLDQARSSLRQHLGWLTVEVSTKGAIVLFEGHPVSTDSAARVPVGSWTLETRAPGFKPDSRPVTVGAGASVRVSFALVQEAAVPLAPFQLTEPAKPVAAAAATPTPITPAATEPPRSLSSPWKTVGYIGGAVGVVGLGIGAAFGIDAASKAGDCGKSLVVSDCSRARWQSAWTSSTVSTVAFVAGGALSAAGIALVLLAPHAEGASPTQTSVRVTPIVGQRSAAVGIEGAW